MPRLNRKPKHPDENTVHDALSEAIARGDFDNLPNKGKPLNLKKYFSVHPDAQLSTQLLIDNKALPKPLQDRKEIDDLLAEAETHLDKGVQGLERLKAQVSASAGAIVDLFPDRETMMQTIRLEAWPSVFPEPKPDAWRSSRILVRQVKRLQQLMHQHNIQAERILTQYLDLLGKANDKIRRLNFEIMADGPVIGGGGRLQRKPLDMVALEQAAKTLCRRLPLLPEETATLIQNYWKKERPSFWQRLIKINS